MLPGAFHTHGHGWLGLPLARYTWACFHTSLPCPSLHTSMNRSVPHLHFDTVVRTLLSSPLGWIWKCFKAASPSEHTQHLPDWGSDPSHCDSQHKINVVVISLQSTLYFSKPPPEDFNHLKAQQWHCSLEGYPLQIGTKHSRTPAIEEKKYFTFPISHILSK